MGMSVSTLLKMLATGNLHGRGELNWAPFLAFGRFLLSNRTCEPPNLLSRSFWPFEGLLPPRQALIIAMQELHFPFDHHAASGVHMCRFREGGIRHRLRRDKCNRGGNFKVHSHSPSKNHAPCHVNESAGLHKLYGESGVICSDFRQFAFFGDHSICFKKVPACAWWAAFSLK